MMPYISVVIPVFKADSMLHELYNRLKASIETITSDFEIIMVEDCGEDSSWDIIVSLAKLDDRVKGLQFSRNFGQHCGISAGLDICNGDWVIVMDCDLQDRPEEIPNLYNKAQEGYDVVLAKRENRKDKCTKRLTSWLFYKIFNYFTGLQYDHRVGNYRIISRKVVEHYRTMNEHVRFFGGLIDWMGFPTTAIDVVHAKRLHGKSTYTLTKLIRLAFDIIIAYSDKPLRLSIKLGFIMSFISFISVNFLLIRALFYGSPVTGWSSLIISLYFIGGIIILNLGIIGIYLGKVYDECKRRPLYIIRRTT